MFKLTASIFLILFLFSGCSNKISTMKGEMKEIPQKTKTNLSEVLSCVKKEILEKEPTNNAHTLIVKDVVDGTIKQTFANGPLSDSGRIQLVNTLSKYIPKTSAFVVNEYPAILRDPVRGQVGLNEYGMIDSNSYKKFSKDYLKVLNNIRQYQKFKKAKQNDIFVIDGAFTAFDSENVFSDGIGNDMGSKGSDIDADFDFGATQSAQTITLAINIFNPKYNLIANAESFTLTAYKDKKTVRLKLKAGEGYFGFADEMLEVEGIHNAQQTLIETATLWIISRMIDDETKMASCFDINKDKKQLYGQKELTKLITDERK